MADRKEDRPDWGPKDYWRLGPVYVRKHLALLALIALSIAVLLVFGLPFPVPDGTGEGPPAYRYDDPRLAGASGLVRVLDDSGRVRYVGEVAMGAYTGRGQVFSAAGELLYDGPLVDGVCEGPDAKVYRSGVLAYTGEMAGDRYEGQGRRLSPETGLVSEGQFSNGLLEGEGREYYPDGTLLREGTFSRDRLEGEGAEYGPDGILLREGAFSAGALHGNGREYTASGRLCYEGQFRHGVYHGQGTLYDTLLGVRSAEGSFVQGRLSGLGTLYHPSGQALYTGQVCGQRPRADAFLGLSLAEVEAAFTTHWLLYTCEGTTAFVYPYFGLMFITESPIELVSPARSAQESQQQRQELLEALERPAPEASPPGGSADTGADEDGDAPANATGGADRTSPAEDELLSPDTDERSTIVTQVLSYGRPLSCIAQPDTGDTGERHSLGWREWFSDFASGEAAQGVSVRRSGQFIWRFVPQAPPEADRYIDGSRTEHAGVETLTVWKQGKDMTLWYQTARWGDGT